jgi:type II secretory pathway pseudopilin PulG
MRFTMRRQKSIDQVRPKNRTAFTLVEMLISVGLILLMMTMFATIFSMATESVSKQRAIADNDQKTRMLMTIVREDLKNRTFKYIFPYTAGEDTSTSLSSKEKKRDGYFYVSCNDLKSGTDDILQFTSSVPTGDLRYTGAAKMLYDQRAEWAGSDRAAALQVDPNQPEFDDGQLQPNGLAESSAAEISYFIRNGNLYRRVMLIREPRTVGGGVLEPQPSSNLSGNRFIFPPNGGATEQRGFAYIGNPENIASDPNSPNSFLLNAPDTAGADRQPWNVQPRNGLPLGSPLPAGSPLLDDFWAHFDFSAVPRGLPGQLNTPFDVTFHSLVDLDNASTAPPTIAAFGKPANRFGFNPLTGLSREHDQLVANVPRRFLGRFLHAETSTDNFNWPLGPIATVGSVFGNAMDIQGTPLTVDDTKGLVTELLTGAPDGGARRSEDLLLQNVHEFRVELWDERLGDFVSPGYGSTTVAQLVANEVIGDYHILRRINAAFGPRAGGATTNPDRVFDTWHPSNALAPFAVLANDTGAVLANKQPPYIAYRFYPPLQSQNGPSPNTLEETVLIEYPADPPLPKPLREAGTNFINRGYWRPNFSDYNPGDIVFAPWIDSAVPPLNDTFYQPLEVQNPKFDLAFRCVQKTGSGVTGSVFSASQASGVRFIDGDVEWEAIDNRRPLKAVRLTFRFLNEKTNQMKELPIVVSLQD